jgi:D-glycero-D-manno-heptose 1,7-bisphosphate phosphatase
MNELNFEPRLREAVKRFRASGYLIIIITNQPDVGYGHLPQREWEKIHRAIMDEVEPDGCYWCTHGRAAKCGFRKPRPDMILKAAQDFRLDLKRSYMIGDTENDMLAGKAARCKTILIRRPYNLTSKEANENADHRVKSLFAATTLI